MTNRIVIAGALGAVGRAALEHFDSLAGWDVIALSRREPDFPNGAQWISVDLRDADDCIAKLGALKGVTHLAYAAVYEMPDVARGWLTREHADVNLAMLQNLIRPLAGASDNLEHVSLLQGTKAYGGHLGPFKQPAKESDARYMPPNFYYDQMDWLAEERTRLGANWTWTVLRPQVVCGLAIGSPMNVVAGIGVFAAISREYGMPLRFPGGDPRIGEATDARLLARAMKWAATDPRAGDEVFNITNGDVYQWEVIWPRIAALFDMELGQRHPISLTRVMPGNAHLWPKIVEKHGLIGYQYEDLVPNWGFVDFILGHGQRPNSHHMSAIKARKHGFQDCIDTEEMFVELIQEMQARNYLPR
jgi:nucleoside-diphosphate-sugar epimerase